MIERLGLVGARGHASDVLGAFEAANAHAFTVAVYADPPFDDRRFRGRNVTYRGSVDDLDPLDADAWILAAGYPASRRTLAERVADHGLRFATVVHPDATIGTGCVIEDGSVILASASLSPLVQVGKHGYISQNTSVGHDTLVGAYGSVMPGAIVSGDCVLEEAVLIGSNAVVLEKLTVGAGTVVAAGAVVTRDAAPNSTMVGMPAKARE